MLAAAFLVFGSAACLAQPSTRKPTTFDLSQIGFVVEGHQVCEDKGRLQDFPSKELNKIIAAGPRAVPVLIGMLTDSTMLNTPEPIICYWPGMAVGDAAFCLLEDLFLNGDWTKTTLPGVGWSEILGPNNNLPAWAQLHAYIHKHGRKSLQAKWRSAWEKYRPRIFWDEQERCFKVKPA